MNIYKFIYLYTYIFSSYILKYAPGFEFIVSLYFVIKEIGGLIVGYNKSVASCEYMYLVKK